MSNIARGISSNRRGSIFTAFPLFYILIIIVEKVVSLQSQKRETTIKIMYNQLGLLGLSNITYKFATNLQTEYIYYCFIVEPYSDSRPES